jgi:hypothetical protein
MPGFDPIGAAPIGALSSGSPDVDMFAAGSATTTMAARLSIAVLASAAAADYLGTGYDNVDLTSEADASTTLVDELLANLLASASAAASLDARGLFSRTLTAAATAEDALSLAAYLLLVADAAAADSLSVQQLVALEDVLLATGVVDCRLHAQIALAAAAEVEDRLSAGWSADLTASAEVADAIAARLRARLALEGAAEAQGALAAALRVTVLVDAAAAAAVTLESVWRGSVGLEAAAMAYVTLRLGGEEYRGWAMNTDLRAVTEHRNVPFDSFASYRGRHFAAGATGIVEIGGDTDDGAPIEAWYRPFLTNFGTDKLKRVPDVYLGITSVGDLLLKAITRDPRTGVQHEDWYLAEFKQGAGAGNARAQLGRGLKSVWWGLEIRNIDGGDFRTRTIQWRPLVLDRRI